MSQIAADALGVPLSRIRFDSATRNIRRTRYLPDR
jgi:hypothetical protein